MSVHFLRRTQCIPASLEKVWDFFVDPGNLPSLTPSYMQFGILSRDNGGRISAGHTTAGDMISGRIYGGQIIEYRLRPFPWLWVYWMTEIIQVKQGIYFIDEQRRGPYRLWHHQHHFREIPGGVEMTDIVHYELPFGFIGNLVHSAVVCKQLTDIFDYRYKCILEIFGRIHP